LKLNRFLVKINRISGWLMLIFMVVYLISGYAWTNRIIMSTTQAKYMHTVLDIYMVPVFLAHILISTKFALRRWGFHHNAVTDLALLLIGVAFYGLVLMIR
jgi:hypothetical protein